MAKQIIEDGSVGGGLEPTEEVDYILFVADVQGVEL